MFEALKTALVGTFHRFEERALAFLPNFFALLILIFAGWIVAALVRSLLGRALRAIRFDHWCEEMGITQVLRRAEIRRAPSQLLARAVFWLLFLVFLVVGLEELEIALVNRMLAAIFSYLPRVVAALLILIVGFLVANFLARAALLAAVNAHLASARLLAGGVRLLIVAIALAMALEQLALAAHIVVAAFSIFFGGVTLALAIAFGLAGRDLARDVLRRQFTPRREDASDELSHL
ncbi:MAG: hypothetical protein N0A16_10415 [Blastocatellia bacterium]|nr:hypothetical protein [Blastocatellia bacterium]MCS7158129.1 hypothetical protein [Blastocatellia bacterium]MCX7753008.1 hypothetical protein [Blastocatellia bacterium]MDW8168531.1 hypothetical protein [Acidobacteriota bacterium]MDW8256945.1 hypothetical protein [Acidobacteriota bacterium]